VRKVQLPSGRRMAQEANADSRKGSRNREPECWHLRRMGPG
jgi:hypothetical protein